MTLTKAMRILSPGTAEHNEASIQECEEAERLGVEALERCEHNNLHPAQADFRRLPSETDE